MELLIAFATDDGENLTNGHAGDANYFYLYKFSDNKDRKHIVLRPYERSLLLIEKRKDGSC